MNYIVMACDGNYAQHLGVCLVSLFSNNGGQFTVYVLSTGISQSDWDSLELVAKTYGQYIRIIDVPLSDFSSFPTLSYYSVVTWFRLKMADYIPQSVNRVLYLDCDTIVCGDISELFTMDMEGCSIAAVLDTPWQQDFAKENIAFSSESGYFNAGVMVVDMTEYRKIDLMSYASSLLSEKTLPFLDQDVLNLCFIDKWLSLPYKWNLLNGCLKNSYLLGYPCGPSMLDGIKQRAIIHYSAKEKPWNQICYNTLKGEYLKYRKQSPWKKVPMYSYDFKETIVFLRHKCRRMLSCIKHLHFIPEFFKV